MKRLFIAMAAIAALLFGLTTVTAAGTIIDTAVTHLRSDPVYVDPGATSVLSDAAAGRIRSHITSGSIAIFVAALPANVTDEVGGNADNLPSAVGRALGKTGAVAVVTPKSFRAGASSGTGLATGQGSQLATLAFAAHKSQGPEAVVQDWVSRVQAQVASNRKVSASSGAGSTRTATVTTKKKSHTGLVVLLVMLGVLLVGVFVGIGLYVSSRRRAFRAAYRSSESQIEHLRGQVLAYSDSSDNDIATALERHQWASSEIGNCKTLDDLDSINEAVEQGFAAIRHYQHKNDPQPTGESINTAALYADTAAGNESVLRTVRSEQPVSRPAPSNTTVVNNYGGSGQNGYWYGGGYYGGSYYGPGYYSSMNFWEGMMLGEMMSDRDHDRGYDHGNGGHDREPAAVAVGDSGGGGDWESTADSGGGDWGSGDTGSSGPSSDPSPSYDPPSYDPPDTSSSGGDWGGGGGFDSGGGGGFDSGGGGGGGGDW